MEDISSKVDITQFGNQKGTSTEHLMVKLMDKLLDLLDKNNNYSAVIASLVDWASAFYRQDRKLGIDGGKSLSHTNAGKLPDKPGDASEI